jgi:hypothetical protein
MPTTRFLVLNFVPRVRNVGSVTVDMFRPEITEALKAYEKHVVCLEKPTEECKATLVSLVDKAIKAYENRGPSLRHGIALDKYITVILSQSNTERPLCAIYFNLHTPYQKRLSSQEAAPERQRKGD